MSRFLAYFLTALLLLQTLGPEVLVLNYQLNKAEITARYCVNKARPQLRCNGKCHLAQQLRKAEGGDKKAPAASVAKAKFEVLPTAAVVLPALRRWPRPARRFARPLVARCEAGRPLGVFRPPLIQS
ncbi:hypothetical protein MON38_05980 [Hymenobacter sp. DH14]|uniref:Uncharacterized protein n=1 Tax=Hymenobacter cyanobacteriorum TaxID=2926463 RepID=A0A9X1VDM3_9BACT|nr:hypothetical protein [Hymenobacter cyanobacteriorum]MCI1186961.1 hypothetical protein [Hymenobacter cyanobacteriorum]